MKEREGLNIKESWEKFKEEKSAVGLGLLGFLGIMAYTWKRLGEI